MSSSYYYTVNGKFKSLFKIKERLDYCTWVDVMESYKITWDIDTKHGKYFLEKDPKLNYKKQAYFEYQEIAEDVQIEDDEQVIKTGKYAFFIIYYEEIGIARVQFFKREKKKYLPLLYEISEKLNCCLVKEGKKVITKEFIDNL